MPPLTGKAALLAWSQRCTAGYAGVNVTNFSSSWADGLAFVALVHYHRPDLINFEALRASGDRFKRCHEAFEAAYKVGIAKLLDVEDVIETDRPDQFSIMTYLSQMYHGFRALETGGDPRPKGSGIAAIIDVQGTSSPSQRGQPAPAVSKIKPEDAEMDSLRKRRVEMQRQYEEKKRLQQPASSPQLQQQAATPKITVSSSPSRPATPTTVVLPSTPAKPDPVVAPGSPTSTRQCTACRAYYPVAARFCGSCGAAAHPSTSTSSADTDRKQREEADRKQREETERRQREETERRQREETERRQREETERRQREETERRQREETERRQREETERRQREETDRKQREETERRQREETERKQREETERRRREDEAERQRREQEEAERQRKQREEAESKASPAGGVRRGTVAASESLQVGASPCPKCKSTANNASAKFCRSCGTALAASSPRPTSARLSVAPASSNKCTSCSKTAYPTESISVDGLLFHKACFRCAECSKTISLGNYASLEGVYYCKPHFKQLFALKGNYSEGFGKEKPQVEWAMRASTAMASPPVLSPDCAAAASSPPPTTAETGVIPSQTCLNCSALFPAASKFCSTCGTYAAAARQQADDARRRQEEEEASAAVRRKQEEDDARRRQQEQEEARKRQQEQDDIRRRQQEEAIAARQKEEEAIATRRKEEEAIAARRKEEEAIAARRKEEEERKRQQEQEAAARRRQQEEDERNRQQEAARRREEEARKQQQEATRRQEEEARRRLEEEKREAEEARQREEQARAQQTAASAGGRTCHACQKPVSSSAKFCTRCGASFLAVASPSQQQPVDDAQQRRAAEEAKAEAKARADAEAKAKADAEAQRRIAEEQQRADEQRRAAEEQELARLARQREEMQRLREAEERRRQQELEDAIRLQEEEEAARLRAVRESRERRHEQERATTSGKASYVDDENLDVAVCGGCQLVLPANVKFCLNCGRPSAAASPRGTKPCHCGNALPVDALFCERCGFAAEETGRLFAAVAPEDHESNVRLQEKLKRKSILEKMRADQAQLEAELEASAAARRRELSQAASSSSLTPPVLLVKQTSINREPLLQGTLWKKGDLGWVKTWKERYFQLKDTLAGEPRLWYFEDQTKTRVVAGHIGYVALKDVTEVAYHDKKPNGFALHTPERIYWLYAASAYERQQWVDELRRSHERARRFTEHNADALVNPAVPITRRELQPHAGWLLKQKKMAGYQRRWCVVRDGILFSFHNEGSRAGAIKYPLYQCRFEDYPRDPFSFQLISTTGQAVFRAESDEALHLWLNVILKHKIAIEIAIDSISE